MAGRQEDDRFHQETTWQEDKDGKDRETDDARQSKSRPVTNRRGPRGTHRLVAFDPTKGYKC